MEEEKPISVSPDSPSLSTETNQPKAAILTTAEVNISNLPRQLGELKEGEHALAPGVPEQKAVESGVLVDEEVVEAIGFKIELPTYVLLEEQLAVPVSTKFNMARGCMVIGRKTISCSPPLNTTISLLLPYAVIPSSLSSQTRTTLPLPSPPDSPRSMNHLLLSIVLKSSLFQLIRLLDILFMRRLITLLRNISKW